jgi:hypothetical protein
MFRAEIRKKITHVGKNQNPILLLHPKPAPDYYRKENRTLSTLILCLNSIVDMDNEIRLVLSQHFQKSGMIVENGLFARPKKVASNLCVNNHEPPIQSPGIVISEQSSGDVPMQ